MEEKDCEGCINYDPYPCSYRCEHYNEDIEVITYCEHRQYKDQPLLRGAKHVLIGKRTPRYWEIVCKRCGEVKPSGSYGQRQDKKELCNECYLKWRDSRPVPKDFRKAMDRAMENAIEDANAHERYRGGLIMPCRDMDRRY